MKKWIELNVIGKIWRAIWLYIAAPFLILVTVINVIDDHPSDKPDTQTADNAIKVKPDTQTADNKAKKTPAKGSSQPISAVEAIQACIHVYEKLAKYDSDISLGIFEREHTAIEGWDNEGNDIWVVGLWGGKLQNGFGAWQKVSASCRTRRNTPEGTYGSDSGNVISFKYNTD